jgi:hypothetical protein
MSKDHAGVSFNQRLDQIASKRKALPRDNSSFAQNNPNSENQSMRSTFNFDFDMNEDTLPRTDVLPVFP